MTAMEKLATEKPKIRRPRKGVGTWTQDPEGVRRNILDVARQEFVEHGLSGARVDIIANRTATSKRMIYYYFKDKEALYLAVLEESYVRIRGIEIALDLEAMHPVEALAALVGFTFDYHADNPDFVRLVMVENIHHARHLKASVKIKELNSSAISTIEAIYQRGVRLGVFRAGIRSIDIHLTISALSFYNISNRASIAEVFGHFMEEPGERIRRRQAVIDAVVRFIIA